MFDTLYKMISNVLTVGVPNLAAELNRIQLDAPRVVMASLLIAAVAYILYTREDKYGRQVIFWRRNLLGYLDEAPAYSKYSTIIWETVHHLRATKGLVLDNNANRLVMSDLARAYMRSMDVRKIDISSLHQEAVDVYFLKSIQDEYLEKVRRTRAYRRAARTQSPH